MREIKNKVVVRMTYIARMDAPFSFEDINYNVTEAIEKLYPNLEWVTDDATYEDVSEDVSLVGDFELFECYVTYDNVSGEDIDDNKIFDIIKAFGNSYEDIIETDYSIEK